MLDFKGENQGMLMKNAIKKKWEPKSDPKFKFV